MHVVRSTGPICLGFDGRHVAMDAWRYETCIVCGGRFGRQCCVVDSDGDLQIEQSVRSHRCPSVTADSNVTNVCRQKNR